MIDLSKNINPYYPSSTIKKHLMNTISKVNCYPHKNNNYVNQLLSKYFNINEENIVLSNGTLDAFDRLIKILKTKKVGFLIPTFWGMQSIADINGCQLINCYFKNDYSLKDISNLSKKVDMIYICNPNNPTLTYVPKEELLSVIKKNSNCHFVIDETLLAFSPNYCLDSLYNEVDKFNNLSVLISFSKIFSLGGLRIAMLCSNTNIIKKIKGNNIMFSTNLFIESIIKDIGKDYFKIDRTVFQRNFNIFYSCLTKKHIDKYINLNVSFVNIKFKDYVDTEKLLVYLNMNNFNVANISSMYLELDKNWIRISVGKVNEMKKLAKLINDFLEVKYG